MLMWKYVRNYIPYAIIAALFMVCEVLVDLLQPELMQRIVDDGVLGVNSGGIGNMDLILRLGVTMILLVAFGGFCGVMNNVFVHISSQSAGNDIRKDCFRKMTAFSVLRVDGYTTGSLVTRVTNDITQIQNYLALFVRGIIRTVMLTAGSIYFMFRLNSDFGLIVVCALPFILGCIVICLLKAAPLFPKAQACLDDINAIMQEDIAGIRVIKACSREIYEKIRFGKANDNLIRYHLKTVAIFAFMSPAVHMIIYFVIALILLAGSYNVTAGTATPGSVMAGITYTTQLFHGILMLIMIFQTMTRGLASWKRVKEILETEPDMKDGNHCRSGNSDMSGNSGILPKSKNPENMPGEIEFRHVSFSYPGSLHPVLDDISVTIRSGETVAVMGTTGSSKSTFVSLIPRFFDVTDGSVLIDGIDVRDYPQKELRRKISVALQKAELFTETVAENILWGNPDEYRFAADLNSEKLHLSEKSYMSEKSHLSEKSQKSDQSGISSVNSAIYEAAEIAQASEFIERLPDRYETVVGERGMSLSGGQRQRLSLARSVFGNPEILVLDDATSALDLKTEADFYNALNRKMPGCTKIIVAQRIATVRRADRILVLDKGKISASGTHDELLKTCAVYREIYDSQMGGLQDATEISVVSEISNVKEVSNVKEISAVAEITAMAEVPDADSGGVNNV